MPVGYAFKIMMMAVYRSIRSEAAKHNFDTNVGFSRARNAHSQPSECAGGANF